MRVDNQYYHQRNHSNAEETSKQISDANSIKSQAKDELKSDLEQFDDKAKGNPLEDGAKTKFFYEKIMNIEYAMGIIVIVNLLLVLGYADRKFSPGNSFRDELLDSSLYMSLLCSMTLIYLAFSRAIVYLRFKKEQKLLHHNDNLFSSHAIYFCLLQSLILLLQPNVWCKDYSMRIMASYVTKEYDFFVNELLSLLALLRFYILIRLFLFKSSYMNPRSHRLCKMHGCEANYAYALKCLFKDSPAMLILVLFGASIILFSFAIQICQRPFFRIHPAKINLNLYSNALWFTVVTMTTVGFGDFYPMTQFGRLIILFVVIWGIFIVSIMVVVVTQTLLMDKTQKKTLTVLKRLEASSNLREAAGQFINFVLSNTFRKRQGRSKMSHLAYEKEKYRLRDQFNKINTTFKNLYDDDDAYEQISQKFEQLNEDIRILNTNQSKLIEYIHENLECDSSTTD